LGYIEGDIDCGTSVAQCFRLFVEHRRFDPAAAKRIEEADMQQVQTTECNRCSGPQDRLLCHELARLIVRYNLTESAKPILASFSVTQTDPRGLCVTCMQQDKCIARTVDGGVWHCHDYK
jgi:hypothetical protein